MALSIMGSVNGAAVDIRSTPQRRFVQSCTAKCHGIFTSYSIWIGVPYGGKDGCDKTYHQLEWGDDTLDDGCLISSWQCVEASDGNTQLWFNAPGVEGDCINQQLEVVYPNCDGGFNCPNC